MSGKQQKGEAISRAARAETGAHRRQVQLVCLDQLPSRHEHQREESARCCHFCRVAAADASAMRSPCYLTTSECIPVDGTRD